jgi:uncharacterized protein YndB with AHSA1/START domain
MRAPDVTVSVVVRRPPEVVWSAVADPARLASYSPETARVSGSAVPPAGGALPAGATFTGSNRNGLFRWSTRCRVVESSPGRAFAFDVTYLGMPVARWRYELSAVEGGTRVEEQWTDHRGVLMRALGTVGTGVADRRSHNERTMRATLDALTTELEAT